jgi:erythromycin 3''-O-methyltransferase
MLTAYERTIGRMYGHVDAAAPDSHHGYLNFGLWEAGVATYVDAAENMVRRLAALLELGPGAHLLDAACGRGSQDFWLLTHHGPLTIDAVDVTPAHVTAARARAATWTGAGVARFHLASATRLPFADSSFTHALSLEAAHHFDTRADFFREVRRVLAPRGRLALADLTLARAPRTAWERAALDAVCALWRIPRANACHWDEYRATLATAGFVDVRGTEVGALTVPGYTREQRRPQRRKELRALRGPLGAAVGEVMTAAADLAYRAGLVHYMLVVARKA